MQIRKSRESAANILPVQRLPAAKMKRRARPPSRLSSRIKTSSIKIHSRLTGLLEYLEPSPKKPDSKCSPKIPPSQLLRKNGVDRVTMHARNEHNVTRESETERHATRPFHHTPTYAERRFGSSSPSPPRVDQRKKKHERCDLVALVGRDCPAAAVRDRRTRELRAPCTDGEHDARDKKERGADVGDCDLGDAGTGLPVGFGHWANHETLAARFDAHDSA